MAQRFSCWIAKATNTHSEYVIVTVFPLSYMNALSIAFGHTLLVLSSVLGFIFQLMSIYGRVVQIKKPAFNLSRNLNFCNIHDTLRTRI